MGWLFKTPDDDAIEATLRAQHRSNLMDTYYERGWGWAKAIIFTIIAIFITSAIEFHTGSSLWEDSIETMKLKILSWVGV